MGIYAKIKKSQTSHYIKIPLKYKKFCSSGYKLFFSVEKSEF
jgi:hypothetical protein